MTLNIFFVDTFTATPFKGNPTSVCYSDTLPDTATMQAVAAELNLPVTAFIANKKPGEYDIKYFTPITEIPACGHATLASARIAMMNDGEGKLVFHTIQNLHWQFLHLFSAQIITKPEVLESYKISFFN